MERLHTPGTGRQLPDGAELGGLRCVDGQITSSSTDWSTVSLRYEDVRLRLPLMNGYASPVHPGDTRGEDDTVLVLECWNHMRPAIIDWTLRTHTT